MRLMDRVATLLRANLNDLVDKAEDPEKMLKQVILDMHNQLMQVKTQVALAIADQHMLEKRQAEHEASASQWMRKAELAVDRKNDALARTALERHSTSRQMAENFAQQVSDQKAEVEVLKEALHKLGEKLRQAESQREMLVARHRRSRALGRARDAQMAAGAGSRSATFDRMKEKVERSEAFGQAKSEMAEAGAEEQLDRLLRNEEIDRLLAEIKQRRVASA